MRLRDLKDRKPLLIINAAELRTGSAFYFSAKDSGSWRLGTLALTDIPLAHAVTASAAFPIFLPALDEVLPFDRRDGSRRIERVSLTDGGVYDNLGLAPLWPDRDPLISLNVEALDTIICCRAGYGLRQDAPNQFMIARLNSAFASIHDRAQNAATKRLFELKAHGRLAAVVMPYLGQDDGRGRLSRACGILARGRQEHRPVLPGPTGRARRRDFQRQRHRSPPHRPPDCFVGRRNRDAIGDRGRLRTGGNPHR